MYNVREKTPLPEKNSRRDVCVKNNKELPGEKKPVGARGLVIYPAHSTPPAAQLAASAGPLSLNPPCRA